MRIVLIGHACAPELGSEPGLTWNLASGLAAGQEVTLITHPQHRPAIDAAVAARGIENTLRLHYLDLPRESDPWRDRSGERGLRAHYLRWQKLAADLAAKLEGEVVHHVSWGTVGAPPHLAGESRPIVWGPLGGAETMPPGFIRGSIKQRVGEYARIVRVGLLPWLPRLRAMARASSKILVCNEPTRKVLLRAGADRSRIELMIDCGLPEGYGASASVDRPTAEPLRVLFAGRIEPRKGLDLLIDAISRCRVPVRLTVAGDGPDTARCRMLVDRAGLRNTVDFIGRVPWTRMPELYAQAHLFAFTSLRDRFGTIVLEAMAHGLPVLGLARCGFGALVPADASIRIDLTNRPQTADAISKAIDRAASDPAWRRAVAERALAFARDASWQGIIRRYESIYQQAIQSRCASRSSNTD